MSKITIFFVLLLIFSACSTIDKNRSKAIVVSASYLFNSKSGKILKNPVVTISNGIITKLEFDPEQKSGKNHYHYKGATLLPGLIDTHVHLPYVMEAKPTDDFEIAYKRAQKNSKIYLNMGFTTVRDAGQVTIAEKLVVKKFSEEMKKGRVIGPEIIYSGHIITRDGSGCDPYKILGSKTKKEDKLELGLFTELDEIPRRIEKVASQGATWVKICSTGSVLSYKKELGAPELTTNELSVIVREAKKRGMGVMAHAHGTQGILNSIKAGVNSIEHGSLINDKAIQLMKDKRIYLVPTSHLFDGGLEVNKLPKQLADKAKKIIPLARKNISKAFKSGVPVAFGSDIYPNKVLSEFETMVKFGLTPTQALQAATINAAKLLQLKNRGIIEAGMKADILVVKGNPAQNITAIRSTLAVFKNGVLHH